jgi:hypothetical protein
MALGGQLALNLSPPAALHLRCYSSEKPEGPRICKALHYIIRPNY